MSDPELPPVRNPLLAFLMEDEGVSLHNPHEIIPRDLKH